MKLPRQISLSVCGRLLAMGCLLCVLATAGACRKRHAPVVSGFTPVATNSPVATLDQLTEAAHVWYLKHHRYPEQLEELVTAGLVAKLPALPPGRRLVYNTQLNRVVVR